MMRLAQRAWFRFAIEMLKATAITVLAAALLSFIASVCEGMQAST
jgi:hypothetical protein